MNYNSFYKGVFDEVVMGKQKYHIKIFSNKGLNYVVEISEKNFAIPKSFYSFDAKKIDKRYLLKRDTLKKTGKIFGIADNDVEADKRIYNEASKKAKKMIEFYKDRGEIKFINKTKHAKNIESKV